ncbi:MAG: nucleotidyltransferase domain-containing protein [Firmicutes bacterium]|nr:nucleotidyltransferase domain-containing protein [Bacillota bacterium]
MLNKVPAIVEMLGRDDDILFCYLFGSVARGTAGSLSDLDFAVYLDPRVPADQRFYRALDIAARLSSILRTSNVDVVPLNDASPELAYSVIRDGKLLFCRDELQRQRFWVRIVLDYLDRGFMRDLFWRYTAKRVKEGSFGGRREDRSQLAPGARETT